MNPIHDAHKFDCYEGCIRMYTHGSNQFALIAGIHDHEAYRLVSAGEKKPKIKHVGLLVYPGTTFVVANGTYHWDGVNMTAVSN